MAIVQIEHAVHDFDSWKAAFDSDPARREASGVRRYQIFRPIDDPNFVAIDLEFATRAEAEAFEVSIKRVWTSPQAQSAMGGAPRSRVVDVVERIEYAGGTG